MRLAGPLLATKRDATNQASNGKGGSDDFNAAYGLTGTNGFSLGEGEYPASLARLFREDLGDHRTDVLATRKADFQEGETGLHEEHQHCCKQKPEGVEVVLDCVGWSDRSRRRCGEHQRREQRTGSHYGE